MTHNIANSQKEIDYDVEVDSQQMRDRISIARMKLMNEQPFYSTLALKLDYKEVTDLPTMAVDGKVMYYNKHFVNALNHAELMFVMCHEILHLVLRHLTRRGKRDPKMWNAAGDYVINGRLVEEGIGKFPAIGGLYDKRFDGMFTEQVYAILEKEAQDGGGSGQGGENFDTHITIDNSGSGDKSDGSGSDNDSGSGSDEPDFDGDGNGNMEMSEDEMQGIEDDMTSALIEAVKASQQAGKTPRGMKELIDEYLEPKINWRAFLQEVAHGQVKNNYTRSRPNRRYPMAQYGVAIPTLYAEDHVEFTLAIDTSGSISIKMLQEFVSEVRYICESFSSFEINILCFDTQTYNHQVFDQDNIDQLDEYELMGRGGTDFMSVWNYLKEIDYTPKTLVLLTDGMPWNSWGDPEYCDTVFIIHEESVINAKTKAPFGSTIYFDDFD